MSDNDETKAEIEKVRAELVADLKRSEDDAIFSLLRLLFWRHLDGRKRLDVLIRLHLIPDTANKPLSQTVEHGCLERAYHVGRLRELWDAIIAEVPKGKRPERPFGKEKP